MTKEQLLNDLKESMKTKNELKTSTLRMLLAAIKTSEVQGEKHEATEVEILDILSREVKRHNESIEEYSKASRADLADKERAELVILQTYQPAQMGESDLTTLIQEVIAATGATSAQDFGKVMKELTPKTKGRADGKMVSELVKKLLA